MNCCGGGMWMMWLWPVLLAALIIAGVVVARLVWGRFGPNEGRSRGGGALEVLEERDARGEIDRDEFERRRDALISDKTSRRA